MRAVAAISAGEPRYTSQVPHSSRAKSQQVLMMLCGPRTQD